MGETKQAMQLWNQNLSRFETIITNLSGLNKRFLAMVQKHQHCQLGHFILSKHDGLTLHASIVKINNRHCYSYAFCTQWKTCKLFISYYTKRPLFLKNVLLLGLNNSVLLHLQVENLKIMYVSVVQRRPSITIYPLLLNSIWL